MTNIQPVYSLVLEQKLALLDESLIEQISSVKKGSIVRKDNTICEYYVIDTNSKFTECPTWHFTRFNNMMENCRIRGYRYLVIIL